MLVVKETDPDGTSGVPLVDRVDLRQREGAGAGKRIVQRQRFVQDHRIISRVIERQTTPPISPSPLPPAKFVDAHPNLCRTIGGSGSTMRLCRPSHPGSRSKDSNRCVVGEADQHTFHPNRIRNIQMKLMPRRTDLSLILSYSFHLHASGLPSERRTATPPRSPAPAPHADMVQKSTPCDFISLLVWFIHLAILYGFLCSVTNAG